MTRAKHQLWLIPVEGPPVELPPTEYGKLEYRCPAWNFMKARLGVTHIEHVTVLWQRKRAHMFVDEMGHLEGTQRPNDRATAIYMANAATQQGMDAWVYDDLAKPLTSIWSDYYRQFGHYIVGPAMLWTGDMT